MSSSEPWNKGITVGRRSPFTPAHVRRIKKSLVSQKEDGLRDLSLFSTAIDTMLRAPDLLSLKVVDVKTRTGEIRDTISLSRSPEDRRARVVRCTLSVPTREALQRYIKLQNKKQKDFIFCNERAGNHAPLSVRQLGRIVKKWAGSIGLDETEYGLESLRRTRAIHILKRSGDLESLTVLLGLSDVVKTAKFLIDVSEPVDALSVSRQYEII